jgi:hypothetical protein
MKPRLLARTTPHHPGNPEAKTTKNQWKSVHQVSIKKLFTFNSSTIIIINFFFNMLCQHSCRKYSKFRSLLMYFRFIFVRRRWSYRSGASNWGRSVTDTKIYPPANSIRTGSLRTSLGWWKDDIKRPVLQHGGVRRTGPVPSCPQQDWSRGLEPGQRGKEKAEQQCCKRYQLAVSKLLGRRDRWEINAKNTQWRFKKRTLSRELTGPQLLAL